MNVEQNTILAKARIACSEFHSYAYTIVLTYTTAALFVVNMANDRILCVSANCMPRTVFSHGFCQQTTRVKTIMSGHM